MRLVGAPLRMAMTGVVLLLSACEPAAAVLSPAASSPVATSPSTGPHAASTTKPSIAWPSLGPAAEPDRRVGAWAGTALPGSENSIIAAATSFRDAFVVAGPILFAPPDTEASPTPEPSASPKPSRDPFLDLMRLGMWRSDDGQRWVKVPHDPMFEGHKFPTFVEHDGKLLALVIRGVCFPHGCSMLPPNGGTSLFASDDGWRWEQLQDPTGLEAVAASSAVSWRGRVFAVGHLASETKVRDANDPYATDPTDAGVWASDDGGRSWSLTARLPRFGLLSTVVATADHLVAITPSFDGAPDVIASEDGVEWTKVAVATGPDIVMTDITVRGQQVLLAGTRPGGDTVTFVSEDLREWRRGKITTRERDCRPVVADPVGFTTFCTGRVWTSTDGLEWTRGDALDGEGDALATRVGAAGSSPAGTIAAVHHSDGSEAVVWFRPRP